MPDDDSRSSLLCPRERRHSRTHLGSQVQLGACVGPGPPAGPLSISLGPRTCGRRLSLARITGPAWVGQGRAGQHRPVSLRCRLPASVRVAATWAARSSAGPRVKARTRDQDGSQPERIRPARGRETPARTLEAEPGRAGTEPRLPRQSPTHPPGLANGRHLDLGGCQTQPQRCNVCSSSSRTTNAGRHPVLSRCPRLTACIR